MARPAKPIDLKLVEDLARIHCTEAGIASVLGADVKWPWDTGGSQQTDCTV